MDDRRFFRRLELRIGRNGPESEPVGVLDIALPERHLAGFSVWLDRHEFAYATCESDDLPRPDQSAAGDPLNSGKKPLHAIARRLAALLPVLPSHLRDWLTFCVCWDAYVRQLNDARFFRFLQSEPGRLPWLLGVPAVQERIRNIRMSGKPQQRRLLASAIAGRRDGRPSILPDDVRVYHRVSEAKALLQPAIEALQAHKNTTLAKRTLLKSHPALMELLRARELDQQWFDSRSTRSNRRRRLTLLGAACEFVAIDLDASPDTVEKRYSKVDKRRGGGSVSNLRRKPA